MRGRNSANYPGVPTGLDFDALQLRLHPAASRVAKLAKETPSSFVAFDVLAVDGKSVMSMPQHERRTVLEKLMDKAKPPLHVTPMTRDRAVALDWLKRFEGADSQRLVRLLIVLTALMLAGQTAFGLAGGIAAAYGALVVYRVASDFERAAA